METIDLDILTSKITSKQEAQRYCRTIGKCYFKFKVESFVMRKCSVKNIFTPSWQEISSYWHLKNQDLLAFQITIPVLICKKAIC